jgi:hypothetical protein
MPDVALTLFGYGSRSEYRYSAVPLVFVLAQTGRFGAGISRGRRSTMFEDLFGAAVAIFVGYVLIEGIARWMLDRRHSRSRPEDQGDWRLHRGHYRQGSGPARPLSEPAMNRDARAEIGEHGQGRREAG